MLSALQLHRKTIKFQKPDTTQGGITFKARYCFNYFTIFNSYLIFFTVNTNSYITGSIIRHIYSYY